MSTPTRTRMSEARRGELLDALLEVMQEVGYENVTMDAVAARAHTSKATLYRHWDGKPQLAAEALRHLSLPLTALPDTGALREDFLAMHDHGPKQKDDRSAALLQAAMSAMITDAELRIQVREQLLEPHLARIAEILARAVRRGEIDPACPALPYIGRLIISFGIGAFLLSADDPAEDFPALLDDVVLPLLTR